MLAHAVYFTLQDNSDEAKDQLIASCHKHLSGHEGVVFYAAGALEPELARPVNDLEFDVSLYVVFTDRAAHDTYQQNPRHMQFIEENKSNWKQVRVFDSNVTAPS
jgi:quinol monooxygenase YgiN